jgi:hypothetical protein
LGSLGRVALALEWQTRLADLLEEEPDTASELRTLVGQVREDLLPGTVKAGGHAAAAGRDVNIIASTGGFAAGTFHGNVTPNPTIPGPADS